MFRFHCCEGKTWAGGGGVERKWRHFLLPSVSLPFCRALYLKGALSQPLIDPVRVISIAPWSFPTQGKNSEILYCIFLLFFAQKKGSRLIKLLLLFIMKNIYNMYSYIFHFQSAFLLTCARARSKMLLRSFTRCRAHSYSILLGSAARIYNMQKRGLH